MNCFSSDTNSCASPRFREQAYNFKFNGICEQDFRGCPKGFTEDGPKFWDSLRDAVNALAVASAVAFDLPHDHFLNMMGKHSETAFRLLHYPPCDALDLSDGDRRIRCSEHTDYCLFTLLFADGPGLQGKAVEGGEIFDDGGEQDWVDVPVPQGTAAVVNLGGLMARCTNDQWRATLHRVTVPRGEEAKNRRFSIACFFAPDSKVISYVHPRITNGKTPKYDPITTEEYFSSRLSALK